MYEAQSRSTVLEQAPSIRAAESHRRAIQPAGNTGSPTISIPTSGLSAQAAKIVKAGGHVGLGGHGQLTGLGDPV